MTTIHENTQAATETETTISKGARPTHRIWLVQGEANQATWTEVAALWPTKNGNGHSGLADKFLPIPGNRIQGRLVVLPARFKPESETGTPKGEGAQ